MNRIRCAQRGLRRGGMLRTSFCSRAPCRPMRVGAEDGSLPSASAILDGFPDICLNSFHEFCGKLAPFAELLRFPGSQLPVDGIDNLNPSIWRDLYVPPMQIIEKH